MMIQFVNKIILPKLISGKKFNLKRKKDKNLSCLKIINQHSNILAKEEKKKSTLICTSAEYTK